MKLVKEGKTPQKCRTSF